MSDLHERAAKILGWSAKDARSISMQGLRELVRPVDPDLAREMDYMIQSGAYIRGEPLKKPRSKHGHATVTSGSTKIWQREEWTAPGALKPFKVSWKLLRPHVRLDEVDEWLAIYRADHPGVELVAAETRPRGKKGPKVIKGPASEY